MLSSCVVDLTAFYKRYILDPYGALMSAVNLQGNCNSKYQKLDLSSEDMLESWVNLCANFGYAD